jgi:hypothetical protein
MADIETTEHSNNGGNFLVTGFKATFRVLQRLAELRKVCCARDPLHEKYGTRSNPEETAITVTRIKSHRDTETQRRRTELLSPGARHRPLEPGNLFRCFNRPARFDF